MFFSGKNHKEQKIEQLLLENYNKYYRLAYSYVHHEADAVDLPHYVKRDLRICKKEPGSFPG